MKPNLGDCVLVFADPFYNNGSDVAPAVITRVWPGDLVNVRVIYDGPAEPPVHRMDWLTSVPLYDRRELAEAAWAERWEGAAEVPVPCFAAFWPPQEPEPVPEPELAAARA